MDRVETGGYTRSVPWFGLRDSVTVDESMTVATAAEMLTMAKLDWTVEKVPLFANFGADRVVQVPGKMGLQRSTDGKIVGIASPAYCPIQNLEQFSWLDNLIDSGEAKYEAAASLCEGSVVMVVASIPQHVEIAGLSDEEVKFYFQVLNSFDGSYPFSCYVTPIRAECWNMMRMGIAKAERTWKIKHRKNALDRLSEARETLGLTFRYVEEY